METQNVKLTVKESKEIKKAIRLLDAVFVGRVKSNSSQNLNDRVCYDNARRNLVNMLFENGYGNKDLLID